MLVGSLKPANYSLSLPIANVTHGQHSHALWSAPAAHPSTPQHRGWSRCGVRQRTLERIRVPPSAVILQCAESISNHFYSQAGSTVEHSGAGRQRFTVLRSARECQKYSGVLWSVKSTPEHLVKGGEILVYCLLLRPVGDAQWRKGRVSFNYRNEMSENDPNSGFFLVHHLSVLRRPL